MAVTFGDVRENEFEDPVAEISHGNGRWEENLTSIVERDGKYYAVDWSAGLTEMQENRYPELSDELEEVYKVSTVKVKAVVDYVSEKDKKKKRKPSIQKKDVESLANLVGASAVYDEVEALQAVDTQLLVEALGNAKVLDSMPSFHAYKTATLQFLKELKAL